MKRALAAGLLVTLAAASAQQDLVAAQTQLAQTGIQLLAQATAELTLAEGGEQR